MREARRPAALDGDSVGASYSCLFTFPLTNRRKELQSTKAEDKLKLSEVGVSLLRMATEVSLPPPKEAKHFLAWGKALQILNLTMPSSANTVRNCLHATEVTCDRS